MKKDELNWSKCIRYEIDNCPLTSIQLLFSPESLASPIILITVKKHFLHYQKNYWEGKKPGGQDWKRISRLHEFILFNTTVGSRLTAT